MQQSLKKDHLPVINGDSKIREISVAKDPTREENTLKHPQEDSQNSCWSEREHTAGCQIKQLKKTKQH